MGAVQSSLKKFKTSVICTIKNVSQHLQSFSVGKYVNFSFTGGPGHDFVKWNCKIFPFGNKEENKNYVSIFVYLDKKFNIKVKANINFTILDYEMNPTRFSENTGEVNFDEYHNSWGYPQFFPTDELLKKSNKLITENDEMNILCEVNILDYEHIQPNPTQTEQVQRLQVVQDFTNLLADPKFSDVTLVAEGLQYKAHKSILSARSPVFSAMFEHDLIEKNANTINIPNMSSECLKEFLLFIYTGECGQFSEITEDLFQAANRYLISDLREKCIRSFKDNLNKDTAVKTLILADLYCVYDLKSQAMEVIKENAAYVVKTESWKENLMQYPEIMSEICAMLANCRK